MYKYVHGGDIYDAGLNMRKEDILDFSANINPMGLAPGVRAALRDAISDSVNYPDPFCRELVRKLALHHGVEERSVYCGNGAADVLFRLAQTIRPKRTLVYAPTFADYEKAVTSVGSKVEYYDLREEDWFRPRPDLLQSIRKNLDLVILCNPNNPTGVLTPKELLLKVLEKCRKKEVFLVVDECFLDFVPDGEKFSLLDQLEEYDNLVILKAFTKTYAIPGVRLGYCLSGNHELLERLRDCGQDWNVSVFAQAAGIAALDEKEYLRKSVEFIDAEKVYMGNQLQTVDCVVYGGAADYVFFHSEREWAEPLRKRGILIRDCSNYRGLGPGYYRIAVKRRKDNRKLFMTMREIIKDAFITRFG